MTLSEVLNREVGEHMEAGHQTFFDSITVASADSQDAEAEDDTRSLHTLATSVLWTNRAPVCPFYNFLLQFHETKRKYIFPKNYC